MQPYGTFLINFYNDFARIRAPWHAKHSALASGLEPIKSLAGTGVFWAEGRGSAVQHRCRGTLPSKTNRTRLFEKCCTPAAQFRLVDTATQGGLFFKYATVCQIYRVRLTAGSPPRSVFSRLHSLAVFFGLSPRS